MKCHCKQYVLCMYPQKNQWNYTTVLVVIQRTLGYYTQQISDFVLPLITRFGLLHAYSSNL